MYITLLAIRVRVEGPENMVRCPYVFSSHFLSCEPKYSRESELVAMLSRAPRRPRMRFESKTSSRAWPVKMKMSSLSLFVVGQNQDVREGCFFCCLKSCPCCAQTTSQCMRFHGTWCTCMSGFQRFLATSKLHVMDQAFASAIYLVEYFGGTCRPGAGITIEDL